MLLSRHPEFHNTDEMHLVYGYAQQWINLWYYVVNKRETKLNGNTEVILKG